MAFTTTKSKGNFVQDIDDNILLDMCGTENLPLGHNHQAFLKKARAYFAWDDMVINSNVSADHAAFGDHGGKVQ